MSAVPAGVVPVVPRAGLDPSFQPPAGATCLAEESRTYLLDGVVYRPQAPWTLTVHALLRHLEAVGYRGSPGWSAPASTRLADSNCATSTASWCIPTPGRTEGSSRLPGYCVNCTTRRPASSHLQMRCGCPGTHTGQRPIPSSGMATSGRGTSSPATAFPSPSSTGSSPGRSTRSTRSPRRSV